jgi:heterodisulfide reductase subunit A-like polyferredoxin
MKKIPCTCALIIWITLFCTGFATDSVAASNTWTVSVDPLKPKRQNEYDVIVIGSGIGGLSCASILSTNGYKVLVLEQHSQIGDTVLRLRRMALYSQLEPVTSVAATVEP